MLSRQMSWIGLWAMTMIVVVLLLALVREPARQQRARAALESRALTAAVEVYARHCVSCHGAAGEGLGLYRPLNQDYIRQQDPRALATTIVYGRYGTEMTAFALEEGGPLTAAHIDHLVRLLQAGDWAVVERRVAELGLTPDTIPVVEAAPAEFSLALTSADPAQVLAGARALYAEHCAECHGADGEGTFDAPQLNTPYVRNLPLSQLLETVRQGRRNTKMESFTDRLNSEQIESLVYLLLRWEGTDTVAAAPAIIEADEATLQRGQVLFETWCAICHGVGGEGSSIAPSLHDIPRLAADFITTRVRGGKNAMPPFPQADLPDDSLTAIIAYAQHRIIGSALPVLSAEELAAAGVLYQLECGECHGAVGEGVEGSGPRINTMPPMRAGSMVNFVRVGSAQTPAIPASEVSDADLRQIIAYLHSLAG